MANIVGTPDNDRLCGTSEDDTLLGFDGNDTLFGRDGNDDLFGENGDDKHFGYNGNDRIFGGSGNDTAIGGRGDDFIQDGDGNDRLIGNEGNDTFFGGDGNDTCFGGSGNDFIRGRGQIASGEALTDGNDRLYGNSGNDTIVGDRGNDHLWGGRGEDFLVGVDDSRPTAGIDERDTLTGNSGADRFILGNASQVFYNDGNASTQGLSDFALITDMTRCDVIQLNGLPDSYVLVEDFTVCQKTGTGIFLKDSVNELIGLVQGFSGLDLYGGNFTFL